MEQSREITAPESCDVAGCERGAVWCEVGEAGDLWLCPDHLGWCDRCCSSAGLSVCNWCDECGPVVLCRSCEDMHRAEVYGEGHPA